MEPHKSLSGTDTPPPLDKGPVEYFRKSFEFVKKHYQEEFDRISSVKFNQVDDDFFFKEYIWVVHATGFSAKAVGKFMPRLMQAYGPWDSLSKESFESAISRVASVCNNPQKAKAVHTMSHIMRDGILGPDAVPWSMWRQENLSSPELLSKLPYVGKVTCFHLARNIGLLDHVKPDLHLVRLAKVWGFEDCVAMCKAIQRNISEELPLGLIDLVLWYSASSFGTINIRSGGCR